MTDEQPVSFDKPVAQPSPPGAGYGYGYPPPYGYAPPYGYPPYGYGAPAGPLQEKPSSNIGWAIAAIFTFWPLAIPAFVYANKVDAYWFAGNRAGAEQASKDARTWGLIGVIVGAVLFVLFILWIILIITLVGDAAHHLPDPTPYPS